MAVHPCFFSSNRRPAVIHRNHHSPEDSGGVSKHRLVPISPTFYISYCQMIIGFWLRLNWNMLLKCANCVPILSFRCSMNTPLTASFQGQWSKRWWELLWTICNIFVLCSRHATTPEPHQPVFTYMLFWAHTLPVVLQDWRQVRCTRSIDNIFAGLLQYWTVANIWCVAITYAMCILC